VDQALLRLHDASSRLCEPHRDAMNMALEFGEDVTVRASSLGKVRTVYVEEATRLVRLSTANNGLASGGDKP
jgi:hypothetical protein